MSSVLQAKAFSGAAVRPRASRANVVVRAEKTDAPAKVARSKDGLLFASEQSLSYLDGSLAGDFGFDPLGMSDPEGAGGFVTPEWLAYSEIIHGRFAMLGAAGCIAPEILGAAGVIPPETGLVWFKSGVIPPAGQPHYWTDGFNLFFLEVLGSLSKHSN
jgi:light-harvesting complex I chlorophyll a/b binding protein 3